MNLRFPIALLACLLVTVAVFRRTCSADESKPADKQDEKWVTLFPEKGEPKGWSVHAWDDVSKPAPEGAKWVVDEQGRRVAKGEAA